MSRNPLTPNNNFLYEHSKTFHFFTFHAFPFQSTVGLLDFIFKFSPTDDYLDVSCNAPSERIGWQLLFRIWVGIKNKEGNINIVVENPAVKLSSETAFTMKLPNDVTIDGLPHPLEVTVKISVIEEHGLWPLIKPTVNFLEDHELSNATFIVDGQQFFVNLDLLSIYSAYFAGKRTEGKENWEIQGIERDVMRTILRMIYYKKDLINDDNVDKIISASKLLKLESILSKCEHFLMSMENVERHLSRLQLIAHTNDMSALHDFCHEKLYPTAVVIRPTSIPEVHSEAYSVPDIFVDFGCTIFYTMPKRSTNIFGFLFSKTDTPPKEWVLLHLLDWKFIIQPTTDFLIVSILPVCAEQLKFALNWCIVVEWIKISLNSDEESALMFQFDASNPTFEARFYTKNIVDETVKISLEWKVGTFRGLRYFAKPFHKFTRGITSDVILQMADQVIFANFQILAHHSAFFRLLAQEEILEIDETENLPIIDLSDVTSEELSPLLSQIYPSSEKIEDENIVALLKLADRFLCTQIMIDCAEFLLKRADFRLETLQLAVEFILEPVKNACLAKIQSSSDLIQAIKTDPYWESLKEDAKVVLMDQILDMD